MKKKTAKFKNWLEKVQEDVSLVIPREFRAKKNYHPTLPKW